MAVLTTPRPVLLRKARGLEIFPLAALAMVPIIAREGLETRRGEHH